MISYKRDLFLLFTILFANCIYAQEKPIGYWQSYLPYNSGVGVATDGMTVYTVCAQSFFTLPSSGSLVSYSKAEGMSDIGMKGVAYDASTNTTILTYQNSNIDLFKDNNFYNIPDLKNKVVSGSKNINHIYTEPGMAYLSTDIGILVMDLSKREVENTYIFYINNQVVPVNGFSASGKYFYAITPKGIFRADKNSPQLQNFSIWQRFDSTHAFTYIAAVDSTLFVADSKNLFAVRNDSLIPVYTANKSVINHIDPVSNGIWMTEFYDTLYKGPVKKINLSLQFVDSFRSAGKVNQVTETQDGSVWLTDEYFGLQKRIDSALYIFRPDGPNAPTSFDIYANNGEVWVAYGGFNDLWLPHGNRSGFSKLKDGKWTSYTYQEQALYDSVLDFVAINKDPNTGTVYAGSFQNGLFILNPDGSTSLIKGSLFDPSVIITGNYQIAGIAFDNNNNLWVTTYGSQHELYVKTTAGNWYKFQLPYPRNVPHPGGPIVVDDNNRKWYVCWNGGANGGGIIVYDDNYTPDDPNDDQSRNLTSGVGYGNLPSNRVYSIAKDKNSDIWVGTDNGIGIVNCGGSVFNGCDAQIPIVQYDQYAGYLFAGENVRSIAVDGANRKWVGTDNGIWLLSPDASKIIYRFTSDNSPLPSNHIEKIAIDGVTGDVYIGTEQGLVAYRSTATDGGTTNSHVISFPNPVPSGYTGTIAIKGLVTNADVRITDVSGQLVYRTTALGGQAVWNGKDYTGHRPQSGVYLIFISDTKGAETYAGKMVFLQ